MIREKKERNKQWYVVIDIIKSCNPSNKPSKIWSEYKKKHYDIPFETKGFEFEATNGRVYELDCVAGKDKDKVVEMFKPKRGPAAMKEKVEAVKKVIKDLEPKKEEVKKPSRFKDIVAAIRILADSLEKF